MTKGTDEKYWSEYDGLQSAKHQILKNYLNAWFPILSSWHGRVLYIDCHAGRGRHKTGHEGSPILALQLLNDHKLRDRILSKTEVKFLFFENNKTNYKILCDEICAIGKLHESISIEPHFEDYECKLREIVLNLKSKGKDLAPSFAFVDPYGFSLSMDLLNEFLDCPTCELFVNFMHRYIDMAMSNPAQEENMDLLFGCPDWRQVSNIKDFHERSEQTISLFSKQLNAEYSTKMYMKGKNNVLKYVLFHATNHRRGREVMKEAIWRVTPDGSFTAYERDIPDQAVLIQPNPNLQPLRV